MKKSFLTLSLLIFSLTCWALPSRAEAIIIEWAIGQVTGACNNLTCTAEGEDLPDPIPPSEPEVRGYTFAELQHQADVFCSWRSTGTNDLSQAGCGQKLEFCRDGLSTCLDLHCDYDQGSNTHFCSDAQVAFCINHNRQNRQDAMAACEPQPVVFNTGNYQINTSGVGVYGNLIQYQPTLSAQTSGTFLTGNIPANFQNRQQFTNTSSYPIGTAATCGVPPAPPCPSNNSVPPTAGSNNPVDVDVDDPTDDEAAIDEDFVAVESAMGMSGGSDSPFSCSIQSGAQGFADAWFLLLGLIPLMGSGLRKKK